MSFGDLFKLYKNGDWNECFNIFSRISYDEFTKAIPSYRCGRPINSTTKKYLFENNALLCEAVREASDGDTIWSEYVERFLKLYSKYRSLTVIPLDLELNVVNNLLWWFIIKSDDIGQKLLYLRSVFNCVSTITSKVLKSVGEVCWSDSNNHSHVKTLVNQLNLASDVLLRLPPISCLQMLSVITVAVLILVKLEVDDTQRDCLSLTTKCLDQLDLLRLHFKQQVPGGYEDAYFKFGMISINSTASITTHPESTYAFVITGSLVCAMNQEYKLALRYLKSVPSSDTSFKFLVNYMKAYCHYQLSEYNKGKLCLAYSSSSSVASQYSGHYNLLLARLLSAQDDHQAALVHCQTVLDTHPRLASLAAHLASTVALSLGQTTPLLLYLNRLVQSLQTSPSQQSSQFEGFEECCLNILCHQYSVTVQEAVYTLARHLYLAGYHTKALDSYCQLIDMLKSPTFNTVHTKLLPRKLQIVHETILAHLKSNNFKGGEQLCRQAIRESVRTRDKGVDGESVWETALSTIEDDIVSMTLLADILAHEDKRKALEELNRCFNALTECVEDVRTKPDNSKPIKELCAWFMSRILLRKAKLSSLEDTVHYFRRALMYMPGDKEVVFHYKQWALWNPDHDSFDPGDQVRVFPVEQLHNLALSHVLGCSVTEEEWAAICDPDSSHNLLDTLFDDDD